MTGGRILNDWLESYVAYASTTETPKLLHFWAGVSAIAGALRRKVWFDQVKFKWYPSFYIVFVAPPGVVAKSTTADIAMELLREVPDIKFGADNATWQSIPDDFAAAHQMFEYEGAYLDMSPVTYVASELGNLVDMSNQEMLNLLITLWDGRLRYEKKTKASGNDSLVCPWINIIGCTTPSWLATNMSQVAMGGGFTSRCVFMYAGAKERLIPFLDEVTPGDEAELRGALAEDLRHIASNLAGPFKMEEPARAYVRSWYQNLWSPDNHEYTTDQLEGYRARKQTHLFKTAMVVSASRRDDLLITRADIELADVMLGQAQSTLQEAFATVGKSEESIQIHRLIKFVEGRGQLRYDEAYRMLHSHFPDVRDYEGLLTGAVRAGYLEMRNTSEGIFLGVRADV